VLRQKKLAERTREWRREHGSATRLKPADRLDIGDESSPDVAKQGAIEPVLNPLSALTPADELSPSRLGVAVHSGVYHELGRQRASKGL